MYTKIPGYPWSVAELFLGVSVAAGLVTLISAVVVTEKARAKWRLRGMIALFAAFPIGFAWMQFSIKEMHVADSKKKMEWLKEVSERSPEDREWFDPKIDDLRKLIEELE